MRHADRRPDRAHPTRGTGRRSILKGVAATLAELTVLRATGFAQDDPLSVRPRAGDFLVRTSDDTATPLLASDIKPGPPILAWPMDPVEGLVRKGTRFNQLLILRLNPAALSDQTRSRATDGIVAYTTICTHSGCDAAGWIPESGLLLCACHSSTFDPKDGARVTEGPAPRSLPALPLGISDGRLVVAGGFSDRVGFEAA